jgi:Lrp/AsnC family leucine-responsive transcriptional regulator
MAYVTLSSEETSRLMDNVGWRILEELQADARITYSELGRRVGLTSPAVAERVRRMEEAGIITGYRITVDPAKLGLPITAIMRLRTNDCRWAMEQIKTNSAEHLPEVLACYRVTGEDSLVLRVAVASMNHMERLVDRVREYGYLTTSVVLSTPIADRHIKQETVRQAMADDRAADGYPPEEGDPTG